MTDIIDIFSEVVRKVTDDEKLFILFPDKAGNPVKIECPKINYIFGNSQYVKDKLDTYSKAGTETVSKFPLIALFCPINENRDNPDYFCKATVSLIIACSTSRDWSNEERHVSSFKNILRPIYGRFIEVLMDDNRFDWGYNDKVNHGYSENYSYGKYGAYTESGKAVSEPIDAINISSMELIINNPNCR